MPLSAPLPEENPPPLDHDDPGPPALLGEEFCELVLTPPAAAGPSTPPPSRASLTEKALLDRVEHLETLFRRQQEVIDQLQNTLAAHLEVLSGNQHHQHHHPAAAANNNNNNANNTPHQQHPSARHLRLDEPPDKRGEPQPPQPPQPQPQQGHGQGEGGEEAEGGGGPARRFPSVASCSSISSAGSACHHQQQPAPGAGAGSTAPPPFSLVLGGLADGFSARALAPLTVSAVDSHTGKPWLISPLEIALHLVDAHGSHVDDKLGDPTTRHVHMSHGSVTLGGLKCHEVSSKHGGFFRIEAELVGPDWLVGKVPPTRSEAFRVLSNRVANSKKKSLDDLFPEDALISFPGIGPSYATRFEQLRIRTVHDLANIPSKQEGRGVWRDLLNCVRKEKGILTEARLLRYIAQAKDIVRRCGAPAAPAAPAPAAPAAPAAPPTTPAPVPARAVAAVAAGCGKRVAKPAAPARSPLRPAAHAAALVARASLACPLPSPSLAPPPMMAAPASAAMPPRSPNTEAACSLRAFSHHCPSDPPLPLHPPPLSPLSPGAAFAPPSPSSSPLLGDVDVDMFFNEDAMMMAHPN